MRLVEVVMLMGAHCVSPVEHTPMMTDAAKVQCAVVIEKDTDKGTMTVTPRTAAADPQVMAAVERFRLAPNDPLSGGGTKIVPAWAPAGSPTVEIKPPAAKPAASASAAPQPLAPPAAPAEELASKSADQMAAADPAADPVIDAASSDATVADGASAPVPEPSQPVAAPLKKKVATLSAPPQKPSTKTPPAKSIAKAPAAKKQPAAAKAAAAPQKSGQCKGEAVAKWYKTADGKKKYRCVKPAGDSAPDQLY